MCKHEAYNYGSYKPQNVRHEWICGYNYTELAGRLEYFYGITFPLPQYPQTLHHSLNPLKTPDALERKLSFLNLFDTYKMEMSRITTSSSFGENLLEKKTKQIFISINFQVQLSTQTFLG